ncbi:MAG: DUF2062 domain-containing protein [Synechococcaceae cyanobacterium]
MPPFQPHASPLPALLQRLLTRGRELLAWLWAQEGSPGQRARGLAAGIFCGCFPFFGLQTLLGVALASVVRGNHLLAAAGTWISNPFTYVPLYWLNYRLGCWLIGPGQEWPGLAALRAASLRQLGWSMASRLLLGSALVGLVASAAGGGLYWLWLEREQRGRRHD